MSDSFAQSDDDLFAYDPSKETKSSNASYDSLSSNSKQTNEFYDKISKDIKDNDEDNFLEINALRVKFSQAMIGSYNFWITPTVPVAYSNTVTQVLDQLTNGKFSDLFLYNTLESNIIRRSQLMYLLNGTFNKETSETDSFKSFMKKIGVDTDQGYVPTYVGTLIRISMHILARERSMYLDLAHRLQIVPNPLVLEDNSSLDLMQEMSRAIHTTVEGSQETYLVKRFISNFSESFAFKLNSMNNSNIEYEVRSL